MIYMLISAAAASLFGIVSFAFLGYDGLMTHAWVDYGFWSLIGAGALMALVGERLRCTLCGHSATLSHLKDLCKSSPCRA